jgi:hypothetical protein
MLYTNYTKYKIQNTKYKSGGGGGGIKFPIVFNTNQHCVQNAPQL